MLRSLLFVLIAAATLVLPRQAAAQYAPTNPYPPYQQTYPPQDEQPAMPRASDLGGTWLMGGRDDLPCEVVPSRLGNRALFINEKGDRAEGILRGTVVIVPKWRGLRGEIHQDYIRWSNGTVWTR